MDFASVLLICFGILLIAGIGEAIAAQWELYRKPALLRPGREKEVPPASVLPLLGSTMADGGAVAEK
jgi:hypothetical protein